MTTEEWTIGDLAKLLAIVNPGRKAFAHCLFRDPQTGTCRMGEPCWLYHEGEDCEEYVKTGKCPNRETCKLTHSETRFHYHTQKAPLHEEINMTAETTGAKTEFKFTVVPPTPPPSPVIAPKPQRSPTCTREGDEA